MSGTSTRRAAGDIAVQMIGRLANVLLGVVVLVVLTRELGPHGFGQWATILAVCGIAGYLGDLGLEPAAVRAAAVAAEDERGAIVTALLVLRLLLAVPAAAASIGAIVLLAGSREMVVAGTVAALMTPVAAVSTLRVVFQFRIRNDVPIAVMTVNSLLWTGAVVALAVTGRAGLVPVAVALAAVNTLTTALQAGLALRSLRLRLAGFRRHAGGLLRVGAVLGLGQLLTYAYVRVDQALVLHYTDERQAGLYGAAYQLLDRAQFLPAAVLTTLLPLLAAAYPGEEERARRIAAGGFELLALVSFPVLAFAVAAAEPLLVLLFGDGFADAAPALPVLMGAFVLTALGYLLGNLALVLGTQGRFVGIAAAALVFNVAANVVLLPRLGFVAAAWVTLATEVLVVALAVPITFGRLGGWPPLGRVARLGAAAAIMAAAVVGLRAAGLGAVWLLLAAPPVYAAAAVALRGVEIGELRRLVRREG